MRKNIKLFRTSKSRRQMLIEEGERFLRWEAAVCYALVFVLTCICGFGLNLRWPYLLAALVFCILQAPRLHYHYKKAQCERKRFNEVNAYMAQMAQAFADSGKLLPALRETRETFPAGLMRRRLTEAIMHIEQAYDVELAEQEALNALQEHYDCERIRTLHEFLLTAESKGGSCAAEFGLLEKQRRIWEKNALKYQNTAVLTRNMVAFEYLLLMLVCMFMLHQFPEDLQILQLSLVQVLNAFLIVCFFLVFCKIDKKCGRSMLADPRRMTEAEARRKLSCVQGFQEKKSLWRKLCTGGYIRYAYAMRDLRREIRAVFPCWLFDVLLLMQSENIPVALAKSEAQAPAVLKGALRELQGELEAHPASPEAFLGFLAEFRMTEVEGIMRKLYAMNCGTGTRREAMELVIDMNMTMLSEAETKRLRLRGDLYSLYYMLPTVPVMMCMAGYGIALMVVIFRTIITII